MKPKRDAFHNAAYKLTGEELQGRDIQSEIEKLAQQFYPLESVKFEWASERKENPGDQYNFVFRVVSVTGDLEPFKVVMGTPPRRDGAELVGRTLKIKFFVQDNRERNQKRWEQEQSEWENLAAQAHQIALGERQSDISSVSDDLKRKAENFRRKQLL